MQCDVKICVFRYQSFGIFNDVTRTGDWIYCDGSSRQLYFLYTMPTFSYNVGGRGHTDQPPRYAFLSRVIWVPVRIHIRRCICEPITTPPTEMQIRRMSQNALHWMKPNGLWLGGLTEQGFAYCIELNRKYDPPVFEFHNGRTRLEEKPLLTKPTSFKGVGKRWTGRNGGAVNGRNARAVSMSSISRICIHVERGGAQKFMTGYSRTCSFSTSF